MVTQQCEYFIPEDSAFINDKNSQFYVVYNLLQFLNKCIQYLNISVTLGLQTV